MGGKYSSTGSLEIKKMIFMRINTVEPVYSGHLGDRRRWPF